MVALKQKIDGQWVSIAGGSKFQYAKNAPFSFCIINQQGTPQTVLEYFNVSRIDDAGVGKTKVFFYSESEEDGYAVISQGNGILGQGEAAWRCTLFVDQSECFSTHYTIKSRPPLNNKQYTDSKRVSVQVFSGGIKDA
ncbi:MAG: hypothetical protein ISR34_08205 [Pirellulales bacterium]|nr:hypothetical protein [Pirellulales bacterium]